MISVIDTYIEFMALRHHFTTDSYDYIKYGGKIKQNWREKDNFEHRKDYFLFQKLSKQPFLQEYILANILQKPKIWIYELISDESEKTYLSWKKRKESFSYIFKTEICYLPSDILERIILTSDMNLILNFYFNKTICMETLYILYMLLNEYNVNAIINDPLLEDIEFKLNKYKPFMKKYFLVNEKNILNIAYEKFEGPIVQLDRIFHF